MLVTRFEELCQTSSQALILIGQGTIFSAGVDLRRVLDGGPAYLRVFLPALRKAFERLFFCPKPVVAAINGHAIAGGCVLACATDYRVMAQQTGRIGVPELLVGVPFPTIALEIMRFVAAPQHVQTLLYGGAAFSPESAVDRGLIDTMVAPEHLVEHAMHVAETLAALPSAAFTLTKRQLRAAVWQRVRDHGPGFDADVDNLWTAPQALAAIRDYVARTFKRSDG